jgi:FAD binding domain
MPALSSSSATRRTRCSRIASSVRSLSKGRTSVSKEVHPMISASRSYDVVILGSGIAGLAGALAAHALGLQPVVLEKAAALGGGTVHSYGLIWVGQNHLAQAAGHSDTRDEVLAYMRFLGGGNVDDSRLNTFVDRSPEALNFFEQCGVRFRIVHGVTDHYYDKAPGSHAVGRSVEADLISGFDLGGWRERVAVPHDVPCFVTAEEPGAASTPFRAGMPILSVCARGRICAARAWAWSASS